jgi:hypothetical protein
MTLPLQSLSSPWPFIAQTIDLGANEALYPFHLATPPQPTRWWWDMTAMQVQGAIAFSRDWTYTPASGGTPTEVKIFGPSYSFDFTKPVVPGTLTTPAQRALPSNFGASQGLAFTGVGSGVSWPLQYSITDATGLTGPGDASCTPVFDLALMTAGVYRDNAGLYYPSFLFDMTAGVEPALAIGGFPIASAPDVAFSSFQPTPAPDNSGGDPSDPAFGGGVPWGQVGSGSIEGISFPVYGYSGAYVPPAVPDPSGAWAGTDSLTVSDLILTPIY